MGEGLPTEALDTRTFWVEGRPIEYLGINNMAGMDEANPYRAPASELRSETQLPLQKRLASLFYFTYAIVAGVGCAICTMAFINGARGMAVLMGVFVLGLSVPLTAWTGVTVRR